MTITIEAKPLEIKAELPGYGLFYLRKLGAAQEAEIRDKLDHARAQIDDVATKYKGIIDKEEVYLKKKDEKALAELKSSEEYTAAKKEQLEAQEALQKAVDYSVRCQLKLWRSDDPEALKRLFTDFSTTQIQSFYVQVMKQSEEDNA